MVGAAAGRYFDVDFVAPLRRAVLSGPSLHERRSLDGALIEELGSGASGEGPTHLRPHLPHAGDCNTEQLSNLQIAVGLDPAAFV